jgi:hypothetical protein
VREGRTNLDESISKYFDDLPLPWTFITIRQLLSPGRARGYTGNDNGEVAGDWVAVRPSGAFMTSIRKLVAWNAVLDSDRILMAAERQQMMTAAPLRDGTFAPYGVGWHVEQFNDIATSGMAAGSPDSPRTSPAFPMIG